MKKSKAGGLLLFGAICSVLFLHVISELAWSSTEKEGRVINWKDRVDLKEDFVIGKKDTLVVQPGTEIVIKPNSKISIRVLGKIEVRGAKDRVVKFHPEGEISPGTWGGITIAGSKDNIVENCVLTGASSGISLVNASVSVSSSLFENCRNAIEVNQKSLARVVNSSFRKNLIGVTATLSGRVELADSKFESIREIGIVVQNGGSGRVEKCELTGGKKGMFILTNAPVEVESSVFTSCEVGAIFRQVGKNSYMKHCRFENNTTGVLSVQFSFQLIADCTFKNNKMALDVREFSSPHITHSNFIGNQLGINLFRKSNSLIDFNVFLNNRTGMEVNFSSYPGIFSNNFERNDMHVKLGKFQSGDWEARAGSKDISGKEASRRGSRNIGAFTKDKVYPKRVNAKGNFWGTDLGAFDSTDKNLEKIWDGKDFGPESYEGYGDEKYAIDHVDFSDWQKEPIGKAGVRGKEEK